MSETDTATVQNSSEIVVLYDARDTNPNGDPLAADNPPRIDAHTQQAIVTDVRLKRYIRDELFDQGHNIFVKAPTQMYDEDAHTKENPTRETLAEDVIDAAKQEGVSEYDALLSEAPDVRYFGATFSFDNDADLELPGSVTGPVQFTLGRSLNPVSLNVESKQQSTVVASGSGKSQGTFATDNRIHYGLIGFTGLVNPRNAEYAQLSETDVERLDSLIWDAITNQTQTRSKIGQTPQFYARVEYTDNYQHLGGNSTASFTMESEKPLDEVRYPSEYSLNATAFVDLLERCTENINTVHLRANPLLEFTVEGDSYTGNEFAEALPVDVTPV